MATASNKRWSVPVLTVQFKLTTTRHSVSRFRTERIDATLAVKPASIFRYAISAQVHGAVVAIYAVIKGNVRG